jgi:IclR family acetate operon transcriptional repressor
MIVANGSVQTLVRAFALLEAVGEHPDGARLCDLSRAVDLHKSTASRLLNTMARLGYVARTEDGKRWQPGLARRGSNGHHVETATHGSETP